MWGVGVWSQVCVLIHPTGVIWDSGEDFGLGSPFLELYCHKPFFFPLSFFLVLLTCLKIVMYSRIGTLMILRNPAVFADS
jgi:hypothetical protein